MMADELRDAAAKVKVAALQVIDDPRDPFVVHSTAMADLNTEAVAQIREIVGTFSRRLGVLNARLEALEKKIDNFAVDDVKSLIMLSIKRYLPVAFHTWQMTRWWVLVGVGVLCITSGALLIGYPIGVRETKPQCAGPVLDHDGGRGCFVWTQEPQPKSAKSSGSS